MLHWVVLEVALERNTNCWAWGLVSQGPGFDEVRFTAADGSTPIDVTDGWEKRPSRHLFTVAVIPEP